jgi:hypothetical protein
VRTKISSQQIIYSVRCFPRKKQRNGIFLCPKTDATDGRRCGFSSPIGRGDAVTEAFVTDPEDIGNTPDTSINYSLKTYCLWKKKERMTVKRVENSGIISRSRQDENMRNTVFKIN